MQTHAHFTSRAARYVYDNCYFEKGIKQQSLIDQNSTLYLNWIQLKKLRQRMHGCFQKNSMF